MFIKIDGKIKINPLSYISKEILPLNVKNISVYYILKILKPLRLI